MTVETKNYIELKDIVNVEIECTKCHAKHVLPINYEKTPIDICKFCGTDWFENPHDTRRTKLNDFLANVSEAQKLLKELADSKIPLGLRLEVKA